MHKAIAVCIFLLTALFPSIATAADNKIPILLLDGQSGGSYHVWQLTSSVLTLELEETGLFQVTVATSPQVGADFTHFQPNFSNYKAIVWNYDAPDWPANLRTQLEDYVSHGGGLVIVHGSDNAFPNWLAYNQMAGLGGWRNRSEKSGPYVYFKNGKLVSDTSVGPAGSHGARIPFQITSRAPEHPIMQGWVHFGNVGAKADCVCGGERGGYFLCDFAGGGPFGSALVGGGESDTTESSDIVTESGVEDSALAEGQNHEHGFIAISAFVCGIRIGGGQDCHVLGGTASAHSISETRSKRFNLKAQ